MLTVQDLGEKVIVEDVPVDPVLFKHTANWLDRVQSRYSEDVVKNVVSILSKSLRELAAHKVDEFVPYGDFHIFDSLAMQVKQEYLDPHFEPRPYMVVLYGEPGTGKTTWVRHVAKKYLFDNGVLKGLYLEVTIGDITSKWVGVPLHTMRSVLDAIRSRDYMSVVLFDEADAIFTRPSQVTSGFTLEHMQLIADMKSQLSFITSQSYPTMIILTTNYKDAIARTDEALADRIIAWLEVPPPPLEIREKMLERTLYTLMRSLLPYGTVIGELAKFRALWYNSVHFVAGSKSRELGYSLRWYTPILPYDADYLIGLLTAWGWNPLDPKLKLDYTFREALRVWDPENPIYKVYGRVLTTLIELYRAYMMDKHKVEKSFLRAFSVLKRGVEDTARLHVQMYVDLLDALKLYKKGVMEDDPAKIREALSILARIGFKPSKEARSTKAAFENLKIRLSRFYTSSLFTHPINPVILMLNIAKYSVSKEFIALVDDTLSLITPITWGIRLIYAPAVLGTVKSLTNIHADINLFKVRLDVYNKLVIQELRSGKLLEPLRIMYTDPDLDRAWKKAVSAANRLPEDYQPFVKMALLPLKELHPVIHAGNVEEKARRLYNILKDRIKHADSLWEMAKELGIAEDLEAIPTVDSLFKFEDGSISMGSSSMMVDPRLPTYIGNNPYHPATYVDSLGTVFADVVIRSENLVKKSTEVPA
jgi:hypothetical protein